MSGKDREDEQPSGWHAPSLWEGDPPPLARKLPDGTLQPRNPHFYVVGPGSTLKSPGYSLNTDYFGGGSLTIDGGTLELWGTNGCVVFPELVLSRGAIQFGTAADWRSVMIRGRVLVRGSFNIGLDDRKIEGFGAIFLDADLQSVDGSHLRVGLGDESSLHLGGDNRGFRSAWTLSSGTVVAESAHSLGPSAVHLRSKARLEIRNPQKIQILQLDTSGMHIVLGADVEVMRGRANARDELPRGEFTAEQANAAFGFEEPPFSGTGIIRVLEEG